MPPRDAALLAWLALKGPTPRSRLAALLWPDSGPESARNALRQRLFQLKGLCGVELVVGSATPALAEGVAHDLLDADSVLGDTVQEHGAEFAVWLLQHRERRRGGLRQSLLELCRAAGNERDYGVALVHQALTRRPMTSTSSPATADGGRSWPTAVSLRGGYRAIQLGCQLSGGERHGRAVRAKARRRLARR